jgi:hypothetical protein
MVYLKSIGVGAIGAIAGIVLWFVVITIWIMIAFHTNFVGFGGNIFRNPSLVILRPPSLHSGSSE